MTRKTIEPRKLATTAVVLASIALLPGLYFFVIQLIANTVPGGFSQAQGYWLLLPGIIAYGLKFTVTPVAGVVALILAIKVLAQPKTDGRSVAIVALILVGLVVASFVAPVLT